MKALAVIFVLLGTDVSAQSLRPEARPDSLAGATNQVQRLVDATTASGGVCGRADIIGERKASFTGTIGGCGIEDPVLVSQVHNVRLSRPALMHCDAANALWQFSYGTLRKAVDGRFGGVTQMDVAAHYSCRTRNNRAGAKLSEHATGRAIDISGFTFADGTKMTVLEDWGTGIKGAMLKRIWEGACGDFGTVLGPNSDRFHKDHFHFDVAAYRSGSYCR